MAMKRPGVAARLACHCQSCAGRCQEPYRKIAMHQAAAREDSPFLALPP